jgi:hypothetical protein
MHSEALWYLQLTLYYNKLLFPGGTAQGLGFCNMEVMEVMEDPQGKVCGSSIYRLIHSCMSVFFPLLVLYSVKTGYLGLVFA